MNTPVVLIIFNRPLLTQKVFEEIKKIKPEQLFIISDGPRNEGERKTVEEVRRVAEQVDWTCKVSKKYSDNNLGCRMSVSSGLDWVFSQVDRAIILEDDCVPHQSFFPYCEELLEKYQNNDKLMHITGSNLLLDRKVTKDDYFFSRYMCPWGWATWKRAWKKYNVTMSLWKSDTKTLQHILKQDKKAILFWEEIFDNVYENKIDTWDHQWTYAIWSHDGYTIMPKKNLIRNIGFGTHATHTRYANHFENMPTSTLTFPLKHPNSIVQNNSADRYMQHNMYRFSLLKSIIKTAIKKMFLK